jgi:hypothetical protein
MAPPHPTPGRQQTVHHPGGARGGQIGKDYYAFRPQLAPRAYQRVAAAPWLPDDDEILFEYGSNGKS